MRTKHRIPQYVALGSSFAAGLKLGPRAPGSPLICMRSLNGYPQQLARLRGLSLVDMSCSGATTGDVLRGRRPFLPSQVDGLAPGTELVTLTIGGNDVGYIGDLFLQSLAARPTFAGGLLRRLGRPVRPAESRDWARLRTALDKILVEIKRRSPHARIVIATYPTLLPSSGSCACLGVDDDVGALCRQVGDRLAEVTRGAADEAGAVLVDMHVLGIDHHACSDEAWINGGVGAVGAPFHPTLAGARAVAEAISKALDETS